MWKNCVKKICTQISNVIFYAEYLFHKTTIIQYTKIFYSFGKTNINNFEYRINFSTLTKNSFVWIWYKIHFKYSWHEFLVAENLSPCEYSTKQSYFFNNVIFIMFHIYLSINPISIQYHFTKSLQTNNFFTMWLNWFMEYFNTQRKKKI